MMNQLKWKLKALISKGVDLIKNYDYDELLDLLKTYMDSEYIDFIDKYYNQAKIIYEGMKRETG